MGNIRNGLFLQIFTQIIVKIIFIILLCSGPFFGQPCYFKADNYKGHRSPVEVSALITL